MVNSIEINDFNYKEIFNSLSLNIEKNKLTTISGSNNSGKTLLFKILSRNIKLDSNPNIKVFDKDIYSYKITDYSRILKVIIPLEEIFIYETVEDKLNFYIDQLFLNKEEKNKRLKSIKKNCCLNKIKKKNISELSKNEKILFQISLAVAAMPKILLIDDLSEYLTTSEVKMLVNYFRYLTQNYDITIVLNSTRLEDIIYADQLCILFEGKIILNGKPLEVLQKDNILNRAGIKLPFMIDLSVKLKDYNLIEEVELDINRMVDRLWN